ncbi:DNA ligase [Escherichia phage vB_EcoM_EP57]|nr:DNA ligase [Escherichia phage vB_EcoM_EP57]
MSNYPITGVTYSCVAKGGLYTVVEFPKPAGISKVFDPVVIYEDLRTGQRYWRFVNDFLDRMEVVSGENTEEVIKANVTKKPKNEVLKVAKSVPKKDKFDTEAFVFDTPIEKIEEALQRLEEQEADPMAEPLAEAKNIGRSNETTPEEQAELEAFAKWTKQLKNGYYKTKEEAENHVPSTPMKCQDYKDYPERVVFPGYAQYKLNGLRSMINMKGECLSKAGEVYNLPPHWKGIPNFISEVVGHPLDGEVFAGLGVLSLQQINSACSS